MANRQRIYDKLIRSFAETKLAVIDRTMVCAGSTLHLLYIKQLVDTDMVSLSIVRPLLVHYEKKLLRPKAKKVAETVIQAADCRLETKVDDIEKFILDGMCVLLFPHDASYIVINLKQVQHRAVPEPDIAYSIRGPKDSFAENLDANLSLIRYRLKDPSLCIDMLKLGRRTQTSMAVIYISDIANPDYVAEVKRRLSAIDTDAVWGSGDLQNFLADKKNSLFPQTGVVERSDAACEAILEGKVLMMADGGQMALVAPHTFSESMMSCDDRYDLKFTGLFAKLLRYVAFFITLCLSSIYVALVSFHPDALPGSYAILLSQMRQAVLFPAVIEVLIVELLVELVREALLRVPSKIGTAIGIVGAIIIGDAATAAGIFDSLVLIIVSTSLLASFTIPDYFFMNAVRILKFLVVIMTGILGFYGLVLALCFILTNLVSIDSFGLPYFAPFAPFNWYDFKRAFLFSRSTTSRRMHYMNTIDSTRGPQTREDPKPEEERDARGSARGPKGEESSKQTGSGRDTRGDVGRSQGDRNSKQTGSGRDARGDARGAQAKESSRPEEDRDTRKKDR